jgi:Holliday junction resolvase YEN1
MGVPGLWKELQRHGCDTALARLSELKSTLPSSSSSQTREHLRLGIDVSSWLFHAQKSIGGHNPQLRLLFYRLCRLLAVPDVLPVFVFDGPLRPKEKRGKVTQMYREVAFISDLKNLIVAFGFVVYDALGEAEAEMARMVRENLLDAVMSDDVDCFVFGATLVIRKWV